MVTASISLVLVIVVAILWRTGRLPLFGMVVSLLCGASLAGLLLPVVAMLGGAAQSAASLFESIAR